MSQTELSIRFGKSFNMVNLYVSPQTRGQINELRDLHPLLHQKNTRRILITPYCLLLCSQEKHCIDLDLLF